MTRILALTAAVLAAVAVGIASYAAVTDNGSSKTIVRPVTVSTSSAFCTNKKSLFAAKG